MCAREENDGFSYFGVLEKNWAVGPNVKKSNMIFNAEKEKECTCQGCFDSCRVILGKKSHFGEFYKSDCIFGPTRMQTRAKKHASDKAAFDSRVGPMRMNMVTRLQ